MKLNRLFLPLWALACSAALLTACKKDDDNTPSVPSGTVIGQFDPLYSVAQILLTDSKNQTTTATLFPSGSFRLDKVPAGTYSLQVVPAAHYATLPDRKIQVKADSTRNLGTIHLERAAVLKGVVFPAGASTQVTVSDANNQTIIGTPADSGAFAFRHLVPGTYVLRFASRPQFQLRPDTTVTIAAGDTLDLRKVRFQRRPPSGTIGGNIYGRSYTLNYIEVSRSGADLIIRARPGFGQLLPSLYLKLHDFAGKGPGTYPLVGTGPLSEASLTEYLSGTIVYSPTAATSTDPGINTIGIASYDAFSGVFKGAYRFAAYDNAGTLMYVTGYIDIVF